MYKEISVSDLNKLNNINIIDIRSIQKYNDNHIPGAINIPKILMVKNYSKYLDRYKTYYVYCQKGIESVKVCKLLTSLGYKVINIKGGYESWILNN